MIVWLFGACCGDIPIPTLNTPQDITAEKNEELRLLIDDIIVDSTLDFTKLQINVSTEADEITISQSDSEIIFTPRFPNLL